MSNRRRVQPRVMDEGLPFFDPQEADAFRSLMRQAFAERGLEVSVFVDHMVSESGITFGLWNVAAMANSAGRTPAAWRPVVAQHLDKMMANVAAGDPFEGLSDDEVLDRVYARLWDPRSLPTKLEDYPHSEFAPGIVEVLGLALPRGVATFNRERVEQFGGWDRLRARGLENLVRRPLENVERIEPPTGGAFMVSHGESIYTASQALLMPHIAYAIEGSVDAGLGWLITMPNRHEFCWHLISDSNIVGTLAGMAWYAQWQSVESTGPLSPHVYWGTGDGYQQVTGYRPNGELRFHIGPELEGIIEGLDAA
jgi:hypothetical protein